ncbi:MAG: 8-oxo-dGTP pyrophosphatase MutT (NUDIX family) [Lentimonas sp.]|jgi:8-oxo-dGTP pyrophosphatase MutT (NUDIX family)
MDNYQVGVFPYTEDGKIVLIKTRDGNYWIFPKGHVEKGRKDHAVAEEEAFEEAGILGKIDPHSLCFKTICSKSKQLCLYPMRVKKVLNKWPESKERERVIVSVAKAEKLLEKDLRDVLKSMAKKYL